MAQHIELDYLDPVHEGFFDAIQEVLSPTAHLRVIVASPTTLQILAGTGNEQASVSIQGRYRWRTTNTPAASLPGGLTNGVGDVFVTGTDNNFTGPLEDPDAPTDYAFYLSILASGNTPGSGIYRKIGEVDVVSGAITAFRGLHPGRRSDLPVRAQADHASQAALVARAAASQSADIVRVEDSGGNALLRVTAAGGLVGGQGVTLEHADGLTLSGAGGKDTLNLSSTSADTGLTIGGDVTLYRGAANVLQTDDELRSVRASSGDVALGARVSGDTNNRVQMTAGGTLAFGPGSGAVDQSIARESGGLVTSGKLRVTGELEVDGDLNIDSSNIGFFGGAPVGQQAQTTDLKDALVNYGLLASAGGATPLNLDGGAATVGALTASGTATLGGALDHDGSTVGLFGVTPTTRAAAGADIKDALTAYGLLQGTSASPLNLDGGALTVGALTATGNVRLGDGDTDTVGFFSVAGAARAAAGADIKDALTSYGLLQGSSASPLDLDGGALSAGAASLSGALTGVSAALTAAAALQLGAGAPSSARLNLAAGTTAAGGLAFGADVTLYRSAADVLKTDDAFDAASLQIGGTALGAQHLSDGTTGTGAVVRAVSPTLTGTPLAPTAAADTSTTQLATTAFVLGQAGGSAPLINGAAAAGTSPRYSRQDHVHPTDTTRAPLASPAFTGQVSVPAGTFGAPGLTISGDTDTGLYQPGADQLSVTTGGARAATFDASGNLDIRSGGQYRIGGAQIAAANLSNGVTGSGAVVLATAPTLAGALTHTGSTFGVLGKTPASQAGAFVNSSGLTAARTLPSGFTINDLAKIVIALMADSKSFGFSA